MNKNTNQPGSVRSCDLIDAKLEEHQLCGSKPCPCCGHKLEGKPDWVGLPAGVKFDPTDQELIEHLEAKVEGEAGKSHPLIDEFIPTIEGDDGICYTHPEKLPGVTRDGLNRHFFHRPSKAYTTGTRKRRKIQVECDQMQASGGGGETRWHKTGKTRPVMANGKQKGCKKILVLYTNFGKNRKPEKTNWVMHQYHLGQHEEEKEGELVVSKIFYQTQPRQCSWSDKSGGSTGNVEVNVKENRGSGGTGSSCSSAASREIMIQRDEYTVNISAPPPPLQRIPSYGEMDQLGYLPLRKPFDEAINGNIREASNAREVSTCEEEEEERDIMGQHHVRHELIQFERQLAEYQIGSSSRPPHSIATIISSPLPLMPHQQQLHHQTSIHHHFLQQEEGQQHNPNKIGDGRSASASGLEELIMMGCSSSSTTTHIIKQQQDSAGMGNTQEAEWLKYSSFWGDHDS